MNIRQTLKNFDYTLAIAVAALAVFGVVMIYAATNTGATPKFASLYSGQRLYVITGIMLMLFFALVDYHIFTRFYIVIYAFCIVLLVVVLFIGKDSGTSTSRWIYIPVPGRDDVSIQPSEFAKIFMILFLAKFLEIKKESFNHILMLGLILLLIALPVFLIYKQPSLSASLVVVVAVLVVLFTGGLYWRTILAGSLLVIPVGVAAWFDMLREKPLFITKLLKDYQWERVETFLHPQPGTDEYRQIQGSLFAIATGGLYGKGFLNNSYVINGHNDFVFSVVAEQFGYVGCAATLGLLAFIIIKCILTALRASDMQGRLIAAGVAGMFLFEAFVNVSAVTELLPNTGMPFPFLSYGGSAMWVHMIAVGLVINISQPRAKSMFED